jgi:hypothetical protein
MHLNGNGQVADNGLSLEKSREDSMFQPFGGLINVIRNAEEKLSA